MADVTVPEIGESITEGYLTEWLVSDGDVVAFEDELCVLETDKVTINIEAEEAGKIEILVEAGETVSIGQTIARIDTSAAGEAEESAQAEEEQPSEEESAAPSGEDDEAPREVPQTSGPPRETPAGVAQAHEKLQAEATSISPSARKLMAEHGIEASQVAGSGKDGRILKEDVQQYLESAEAEREAKPEPTKAPAAEKASRPAEERAPRTATGTERVADPHEKVTERTTRTPMTRIRQRIAERMVQAQQSAAILTTFNEADMTNAMALRKQYNERFQERYGVKLGFMSIFVKAVVDALQAVPEVNAQIDGNDIVQNHFYDIGVAVSTDRGLVVPVIRDADRLSFAEIELEIARLANKARDRTITLEDLSGGVFTISNGGIYGNMMSTPILNPPQSGVLGMHAIKKRPMVVDDEVQVRPMMYVALSYDHRLVDGREAVTFLKRVVECVENPERMMLEV